MSASQFGKDYLLEKGIQKEKAKAPKMNFITAPSTGPWKIDHEGQGAWEKKLGLPPGMGLHFLVICLRGKLWASGPCNALTGATCFGDPHAIPQPTRSMAPAQVVPQILRVAESGG